ncbi:hypothetical protein QJS10_CPB21g01565 [Acorus calamus]|uniref:OVATE domain-containing protein n=1 Tax=Acorus calamus TaxID=4465 RepID=A0AAV9C772_ACOCL|nr:hypothetical protein QJS10_CPB21g01565 [Acorus calamus]
MGVSDPTRDDEAADQDPSRRRFEKQLVEMVVEEGRVKELEELLFYWEELKSPLFLDLLCSFYGELCRDLFSGDDVN